MQYYNELLRAICNLANGRGYPVLNSKPNVQLSLFTFLRQHIIIFLCLHLRMLPNLPNFIKIPWAVKETLRLRGFDM